MILYRWRGAVRNFGDELNTLLWPKLLPNFFDDDPAVRFLGVGSILDRRHDGGGLKLVAGSGYGGYEALPRLDQSWIIHWVRGPRTAVRLGLPETLGFGDPASLLEQAGLTLPRTARDIGFMPHFESAAHGAWEAAAAMAGITLIDPRDDPTAVIAAMSRCRLLISEAMHGIIVADSLRVPWIAIQPLAPIHRAKWWDWADTLQLRIQFRRLPPSSAMEWAAASALASCHTGRQFLQRHDSHLRDWRAEAFLHRAADALRRTAGHAAQLSDERTLDTCQARMLERVESVRRQPYRGLRSSRLPDRGEDTCVSVTIPRTYPMIATVQSLSAGPLLTRLP
jgi:succinoglycan biosynthesis protein ExoV